MYRDSFWVVSTLHDIKRFTFSKDTKNNTLGRQSVCVSFFVTNEILMNVVRNFMAFKTKENDEMSFAHSFVTARLG